MNLADGINNTRRSAGDVKPVSTPPSDTGDIPPRQQLQIRFRSDLLLVTCGAHKRSYFASPMQILTEVNCCEFYWRGILEGLYGGRRCQRLPLCVGPTQAPVMFHITKRFLYANTILLFLRSSIAYSDAFSIQSCEFKKVHINPGHVKLGGQTKW